MNKFNTFLSRKSKIPPHIKTLYLGLLFTPFISIAQNTDITGVVIDIKNQNPLPGVHIINLYTKKPVAVTNSNGWFTIKGITPPDSIEFTCIGYKSKKVLIVTYDKLTVSMEENNLIIKGIEITAHQSKRLEQFLEVPFSSSGIQTIPSTEIHELRSCDAYDLFQTSLGLTISRQGSRVHNWVSGRGAGNSSMGIILDGVFLSSNQATRILGDISLNSLGSVNIIRDASLITMGPVSSGNSGSPNQGYIILNTKQGTDTTTTLSASYGSWNTINVSFFHGMALLSNLHLGLGYAKSVNDDKIDKWGNWNNACDANLFWSNVNYTGNKILLKGTILYNIAKRDIQRYQEADGAWGTAAWSYEPITILHGGIDISYLWNNSNTTEISAGTSKTDGKAYFNSASSTDYFIDTLTIAEAKNFEDKAQTINVLHSLNIGRNRIKVGGQSIFNYSISEMSTTPDSDNKYGVYAINELRVNRLVFEGGIRLDKLYIKEGTEKYTADGITTKTESNMWANDAWTGLIGTAWTPDSFLSFSGRISMTNTPTPSSISTVGNKVLPDEKWIKYELGTALNLSKKIKISVTGYLYEVKNAKTQAVDGEGMYLTITTTEGDEIKVYDSNKELTRKGFEAMFDAKILKSISFNSGISVFSSSLTSEDTTMARYKITGKLRFEEERFNATLSMVDVPEYWHNNHKVGNYTLLNANIGMMVSNNATLSIYAKNLTDQKYTTRYKGVGKGYFYDIGAVYGIEMKYKF